jgi:hypothetical protein
MFERAAVRILLQGGAEIIIILEAVVREGKIERIERVRDWHRKRGIVT